MIKNIEIKYQGFWEEKIVTKIKKPIAPGKITKDFSRSYRPYYY